MINFFKMKYYNVKNKTARDGLTDLKQSSIDIKDHLYKFFVIFAIFSSVAILKDFLFANAASGNVDFQTQNSLMLQGNPDFGFVAYIISFFLAFMIYFFTIDAFSQISNRGSLVDSLKFSLLKILDYKVYVLAFSAFLFMLFAIRIAAIPIANALPDVSAEEFMAFAKGFFASASEGELTLQQFIENNTLNSRIAETIRNLSPTSFMISISSGLVFALFSLVFHFTMFINITLYNGMTFFESLKASVYMNIVNGVYLMIVTLGIVLISVVLSIFNSYFEYGYLKIIASSFSGVYTLYLFTWIITSNTEEKS